jgi:hypothetical protein
MITNTTTGTDTYTPQNGCNDWLERSLYGGAITCQLPTQLRDISNVRQVPDHQECYQGIIITNTHNNSNSSEEVRESLFVMEILEQQVDVDHENIVEYLFNDLAESNGCTGSDVVQTTTTTVPSTTHDERPRILSFHTENDDPMIRMSPPNNLLTSTNMESMMEIDNDDITTTAKNHTNAVQQSAIIYRSGCGLQRIHPGKDHINPSIMETLLILLYVIRLPSHCTDLLITLSTPITNDGTNETPPRPTPATSYNNNVQQQLREIFQQIISSIHIRDLSLFTSS